jgi:hypothetical protein
MISKPSCHVRTTGTKYPSPLYLHKKTSRKFHNHKGEFQFYPITRASNITILKWEFDSTPLHQMTINSFSWSIIYQLEYIIHIDTCFLKSGVKTKRNMTLINYYNINIESLKVVASWEQNCCAYYVEKKL